MLGLCLFNILFLSSNLLYVSEIVFICIFYNKCVRDVHVVGSVFVC